MRRYLLFFSYLGTPYRGLAKQKDSRIRTVIDTLEKTLECVQPVDPVNIVSSSRTDKGVHALCNTAHVDLQPRKEGYEFDPWLLTFVSNQMLNHNDESIRVLQTLRVPNDFHSRHHAIGRTYVYRIQVSKKPKVNSFAMPYSALELNRIHTISNPIDMDLVRAAAERLNGEHDFSAFTTIGGLNEKENKHITKHMKVVVEPGKISFQEHMDLLNECYDVWDIKFTSSSYLYHQVRQMTGALLAVGRKQLPIDTITDMLRDPMKYHSVDHPFPDKTFLNIPADALYLAKVHYNEKDLQITEEEDSEVKLFNPIQQLKDTEIAYNYVLKACSFTKIHKKLLDPDGKLVTELLEFYKNGKPSSKYYKMRKKLNEIKQSQQQGSEK